MLIFFMYTDIGKHTHIHRHVIEQKNGGGCDDLPLYNLISITFLISQA